MLVRIVLSEESSKSSTLLNSDPLSVLCRIRHNTDNGTEFSNPEALEFGPDGERRSWVFYCNPSAPNQKGACENNHEFIRRVIPKGKDIGKYSQEQINLMMNHINSYSRPELGNKPPYAMLAFHYGKRLLKKLGFERIQPNDIILKPSLLRKHD